MVLNPALYAFTAEYRGEHPAYGEFEEYLRTEFANLHPGWEPRFGEATSVDPDDYVWLLHGSVPEATSHEEAQSKVRKLLHDIAKGFNSRRPKNEKQMPEAITRVWRWRS